MLEHGFLNPAIRSLLARVRQPDTMIIADRGFSFWPTTETAAASLIGGVPVVLQFLDAGRADCAVGQAFMAEEFLAQKLSCKLRVPRPIILTHTGKTTRCGNVIPVPA